MCFNFSIHCINKIQLVFFSSISSLSMRRAIIFMALQYDQFCDLSNVYCYVFLAFIAIVGCWSHYMFLLFIFTTHPGGTSTPAQLGFTNLRYTNPYVPISYVPSSSVPNLIFTMLQKWSHALGKARPHGRPGRRGAVRREGLRPSLLSLHFSIASGPVVNSRCGGKTKVM